MAYSIVKGVIDYITVEQLKEFLRQNRLPISGSKQEITERIINAINGGSEHYHLNVDTVDQFLVKEISNGKNRMLFISSFPETAISLLQDPEHVMKCLQANGYPEINFNNLRIMETPENTTLVYLNINQLSQIVERISMCFAKTNVVSGITDEEGNELPPRKETEYVWVEILPADARIIIKTRPIGQNVFGNHIESQEFHQEIDTLVRTLFSLVPRPVGHIKNVLYNMFRDLTETAERPYREKVAPYKEKITKFANDIALEIGLGNVVHPLDLPHRVTRLLERALIQQDFEGYERYFEGKRGIVNRIYYSDATGATVSARSSEREEGIAVADIYFDTKESIESRQILDKIWVTWFYKKGAGSELKKVETKFEVHKDYFILHFLYGYSPKEIQDHVLSNFKYYEEL